MAAESSLEKLIERLELLRRLDSIIDLAKGWLQLRILAAIGSGASSVDDVVKLTGVNRKAVLDSLRKMRLKGLVEALDNGSLKLTSKGAEAYGLLQLAANRNCRDLVVGEERRDVEAIASSTTVYDVSSVIVRYVYLYETIVALALARGSELSLEELSSIVRLSPRQLDSYLRYYADSHPRLLIRIVGRRSLLDKLLGRSGVRYRLGRDGTRLLYRLPEYMRFKRSLPIHMLSMLTRTMHPRLVLKRLTLIISAGSALAMLSAVFADWDTALLIMGSWLVALSFLALLVEYSY